MTNICTKKFDTGYTQVLNAVLHDNNLSLKAKGAYAYLFSKPDGWQFHADTMATDLKESHKQVLAIVKELISAGYIRREQVNTNGRFGGIVYVFINVDRVTQIPHTQKSACGKTGSHNKTDYISKTDYKNKEIDIKKVSADAIVAPDAATVIDRFTRLWNDSLVKYFREDYPSLRPIPKITRSEIKYLSARDKELRCLVSELIENGTIPASEAELVKADIWKWAFEQLYQRMSKSRFMRGEIKPSDGHAQFVFTVDTFLRKANFIRYVNPNSVYMLD